MCGRFTLTVLEGFPSHFEMDERPPLLPRFNIAPSQDIAVIRRGIDGVRRLDMMIWGLVPHWTEPGRQVSGMINARSETAHTRPAFRDALQARRCLIAADGFFEWKRKGTFKQPYYFRLKSHGLFAFAGLWESWSGAGDPMRTCAILTTDSNSLVGSVHDRMPVILPMRSYAQWLDPEASPARLRRLLGPFPAAPMESYAVGRVVNSPHNDSPECIRPLGPEPSAHQPGLFH